jgi:hypothetical protein
LAAVLVFPTEARRTTEDSVKMQSGLLQVYNYADVDSETTLILAKQETTRIYREIGIEAVGLDQLSMSAPYR